MVVMSANLDVRLAEHDEWKNRQVFLADSFYKRTRPPWIQMQMRFLSNVNR